MPRLSVPLTDEQHRAIRVKAAELGIAQAEVARRLLLAWLRDELVIHQGQVVAHLPANATKGTNDHLLD